MMDITFKVLLALLILTAGWGAADQQYQTWVSNGSSLKVVASINYDWSAETSSFQNREIDAGTYQGETYAADNAGIDIYIQVYGSCCVAHISLFADDSVVALDSGNGGVNIFKAVHGTLFQPLGQPLTIIYPEIHFNNDGQPNNSLFCNILDCLA